MGTLLLVCVRRWVGCVWKARLTHVQRSRLMPVYAILSRAGFHGTFVWGFLVNMCTCTYAERLLQARRGALRHRMELIAATRNDKTAALPMIVIREKTTLTSRAAPAAFSCSDLDFLSSYSRPNSSGKCLL